MAVSRRETGRNTSGLVENVKTIIYAVLIALLIRTVAFEPFNIPSGSMIPTLLIGDYLFVGKYTYGYSHFSLPFAPDLFDGRIFSSLPKRGDVVVFKYPRDTSQDYIKRVIGLPGDRIWLKQGQLYINGTEVPRTPIGDYIADDEGGRMQLREYTETLPGSAGAGPVAHPIIKESDEGRQNNTDEIVPGGYVVPPGHVFCMGDNRDNSADSRFPEAVGFVPVENLVGRAEFIFFSIDATHPWWQVWEWPFEIRWSRLLSGIH